jgi:hypothetical protein
MAWFSRERSPCPIGNPCFSQDLLSPSTLAWGFGFNNNKTNNFLFFFQKINLKSITVLRITIDDQPFKKKEKKKCS